MSASREPGPVEPGSEISSADTSTPRSVHRGPETEDGQAWRRVLINGCRSAGRRAESIPLLRDMAHTSLARESNTALWDELISTIELEHADPDVRESVRSGRVFWKMQRKQHAPQRRREAGELI